MDMGIRCLIGNIGKPGVALLLSPRELILPEPSLEKWNMVNHVNFDGRLENNFKGTSLHLSLTGYEQGVNVAASRGRRDKEVFYVEAVVSAHDCGTWVGDLDILALYNYRHSNIANFGVTMTSTLKGEIRVERALPTSCSHSDSEKEDQPSSGELTAIDNWQEVLDPPLNMAVVRANGNWIARLALAAAMHGRGNGAIIASEKICWKCVGQQATLFGIKKEELLVLC